MLNGAGNRRISDFVRRGGAYMGFCAGGYYGAARCEFEIGHPDRGMEVIGSRELAFFPGTCRGGAFKGFKYASESGAKAVKVKVMEKAFEGAAGEGLEDFVTYFNGGGVFVDAGKMGDQGIEVLASFADELDVDGGEGEAAVVYCKVGSGGVILTGPHPEFAAVNLEPHPDVQGYDKLTEALAQDDDKRTSFLKACLTKLGLDINTDNTSIPSLSKIHLSALDPQEVGGLLTFLNSVITKDENGEELIKGENDTFHVEHADTRWSIKDLQSTLEATHISSAADDQKDTKTKLDPARAAAIDGLIDHNRTLKTIVPHESAWPEPKETPYFNHADYYSSLVSFRRRESDAYEWGAHLLYGEVVTSTNTLLEKNPSLLTHLPTGFTMAATTQIAGRGRGTNVWIAPPGCMIFSTVINHPAHLAQSRPVVFIQYLAAIAIVEAVRTYDGGAAYSDLPVKLKWPNDVYAQDPENPWKDAATKKEANYVKIGGILTNCAYSNGAYQMVVGVGLNTTNGKPTTSLDAVLAKFSQRHNLPPFRIERLLARLLTRFESLYREFVRNGFTREMEERYYDNWLHTNQMVTLEAEGGVKARIVGITRDWGLLRAQEVGFDGRPTGRLWALQSDENSFDFWRGLVKRKL